MATLLFSTMGVAIALFSFFIMGDFTQQFYKPSRRTVLIVKHHQYWLMAAAIAFWVAAWGFHQSGDGRYTGVLVLTGILTLLLLFMSFYASYLILFQAIRHGDAQWLSAADADQYLDADEQVVGIEINGDARAYPVKWMRGPHVVEETIGSQPVAMTYCMLTNMGQAYAAEDRLPSFKTLIQWNNNLVLYDTENKQLLQQIEGETTGDATPQPYDEYPTRIMSWAAWRKFYPETQVLYNPATSPRERMVATILGRVIEPAHMKDDKAFFPTIDYIDQRLPSDELVVGIRAGNTARAYSTAYLKDNRTVNTTFVDLDLLVVADPHSDATDVFRRTHNGTSLNFAYQEDGAAFAMRDSETGSTWDFYGRAVNGRLKGEQLERVNHVSMVYWMVWSNFYPDTELVQ